MNNHITVLILARNVIGWLDKCIESALGQDYDNFDIIFIDARSTDGTYEKMIEYALKHKNLLVVQNTERKFQTENMVIGTKMAKENSIMITLDGDDWFAHENVLARVNAEYKKKDIWISYGTYQEFPYRDVRNIYHAYPKEVIENKTFREHQWLASHLRTYRRELFLKINENDLKDSKGNFFEVAGDLAFQFPMLEMAGNKSSYIPDELYIYNRTNPVSEANIYQQKIDESEKYIRTLPKYKTLEKLYEPVVTTSNQ